MISTFVVVVVVVVSDTMRETRMSSLAVEWPCAIYG